MTAGYLRLHADDCGAWRQDKPGRWFGLQWDEIVRVGGYKLDGITEVYTVVELDHPSGHGLELHADWTGFSEVVEAIAARLDGIPTGWLTDIERCSRESPRSRYGSGPSSGALAWAQMARAFGGNLVIAWMARYFGERSPLDALK